MATLFRSTLLHVNGMARWATDTFKIMLTTNSYTPDYDAHDFKADVTNEVTGTNYVAGGATLASLTKVYTAANSWATARANSTAYVAGQIVIPATPNGYVYQCVVAGTSGGSIPTYPTVIGTTVADGTVTWLCAGKGVVALDAADVSWSSSTITARRAVIYNDTPGSDATRVLIACEDFGSDVSSTNATFQITWHAQGIILLPVP